MANKLDDLQDVRRDLAIDVLFLSETWHDADSLSFSRLRRVQTDFNWWIDLVHVCVTMTLTTAASQ